MTHIAIIDASIGDTPAQENLERMTAAETTTFKASEGDIPPPPSEEGWAFDGVMVSGSQCSVYEDRDWIHELTRWARQVHADGMPMLGICWGHQFLAQALGGRIVAMDRYELGYKTIEQVRDSRLLDGIPEVFTAFETHSDRVYELPDQAEELATNEVGNQAFRTGRTYGVQFHPEYDLKTATLVTERKDLPDERIEAVLAGITESAFEEAKVAARVFENFETIVENRRC
ncbi:MAG: type 1 glutamine amidotransferase [Halodesulfurarchaeum sp.]|nr:type 1 glutamine amidotransferase [Halodesulfurarchaeum sp.]